jgi:hypothetical protein
LLLQAKVKQVLSHVLLRKQRAAGRIHDESSCKERAEVSQASQRESNVVDAEHGDASCDTVTLEGRSLGLFGPNNIIRRVLARIIWHPRFEQVVIVLIIASSITLAMDSPTLDPESRFKKVLVSAATVLLGSCVDT